MSVLEKLRPQVDATIDSLAKAKFRADPIAGVLFSRLVSVMSSAYKRHGGIIEAAVLECLKASDRYDAWRVDRFGIQQQAKMTVTAAEGNPTSLDNTHLPYVGDGAGQSHIQIDAIAVDKLTGIASAYEVKRGNGYFDAGKQRSIKRDALLAKILLRSHCEARGFKVSGTRSHIIFYYGLRSIPAPIGLIGKEMDEHFGIPMWDHVEEVNTYFRTRLFEIISR